MWKSPIPQAMTAMQQEADRDISVDAVFAQVSFTDPFSNSLLLTIQLPDTLTPEVQQC